MIALPITVAIIAFALISLSESLSSSTDRHAVSSSIPIDNNRVLSDGTPYLAILLQIGQFIHWDSLLDCIDNTVTAKSFNTDKGYLNLTTYYSHHKPASNFNIDLYMSFNHAMDAKHRLSMISDVNKYKNEYGIKEIFTSTVKNTGLDLKPFLEQINEAHQHRNYDIILKLHSKSNKQWLTHSLQCLCGTPMQVLSIVNHFTSNDKVRRPVGLDYVDGCWLLVVMLMDVY